MLAVCLGLLAGGPYESTPPGTAALALCSMPTVVCSFADGSPRPPRTPGFRELAAVPLPTHLATDGVPGCVRGSARPVLGTTMPTLQVTFASSADATFELVPLGGSAESNGGGVRAEAGKPAVWDAGGFGLEPGRSYRWRVRGTPWFASTGWSEWCEFTVAAGLAEATDVDTVQELGVEPLRRYPVRLSARQWELVLDAIDVEGDDVPADGEFVDESTVAAHARQRQITAKIEAHPGTLTLTGADWALVAVNLAAFGDGSPYRKTLDRISAQLGGPAHPLRA